VTNAFSNDAADRLYQDLGFDGNNDDSEVVKRAPYLAELQGVVNNAAYQQAVADPSADDYIHYRDASFTGTMVFLNGTRTSTIPREIPR
jgi:cell surface protein SprA